MKKHTFFTLFCLLVMLGIGLLSLPKATPGLFLKITGVLTCFMFIGIFIMYLVKGEKIFDE